MDFPAFILTLLSGNWLFFNDGEIAWDGSHHSITGLQVNAAQASDLMGFVDSAIDGFEDINEVANYFIGFLGEIEKDEGLKVPRSAIAPGVRKALPEGDLTGITLANLAACGAALSVQNDGVDQYVVIYDTRLSAGIPGFFNLVARLLWDLRACMKSQKDKPFTVTFAGARNVDADQYFGTVSKPVDGAQNNPIAMTVSSVPEVVVPKAAAPQKRQSAKASSKRVASADEESRGKKRVSEKSQGPDSGSKKGSARKTGSSPQGATKSSTESEEARMRRAERAALAAHKRVEKKFVEGRYSVKSPQFDGSARERILYHLLETGGGLTPEELEEDLKATCGVKWKPKADDDGQIQIDSILAYMERPGSEIGRVFAMAGGAGIVDGALQMKINEQRTIVKSRGKVFLWCQEGIDYGARLAMCKERQAKASEDLKRAKTELSDAEKELVKLEGMPSRIAQLKEKKAALVDELGSLGLFQRKQKKDLKSRIGELQSDIKESGERMDSATRRVDDARKRIADLESEIKSLDATYKKERKKCLRLWDSGKLR